MLVTNPEYCPNTTSSILVAKFWLALAAPAIILKTTELLNKYINMHIIVPISIDLNMVLNLTPSMVAIDSTPRNAQRVRKTLLEIDVTCTGVDSQVKLKRLLNNRQTIGKTKTMTIFNVISILEIILCM
jgi:hypothetical protein